MAGFVCTSLPFGKQNLDADAAAEQEEHWAASNRDFLAGRLDEDLADRVPCIRLRPVLATSMLLAVSQGSLAVDDTMQAKLAATGLGSFYQAINANQG